ncbi:hypothetical protein AB0L74_26145 [Streptomyces sp. NPDC052020]|uniref:hypothetical protein n=1 Tax=Streptomyces sp. NPDC052020 TaxID=3155677 RepID=UPI003439ACFF
MPDSAENDAASFAGRDPYDAGAEGIDEYTEPERYDEEPEPYRVDPGVPVAAPDGNPDVFLDVPLLKVDEIDLDVENLRAHVSLQAEVLDLLKLNVGADVLLGRVHLGISGVEAQAQLRVRLDNVTTIIDRVLTTLDRNPELLRELARGLGSAVRDVGGGARSALGELGTGAGRAVQDVGRGAGSAVRDVGVGAGGAVRDVGHGVGAVAEDVGHGAGAAVRDVGGAAGRAVGDAGGEAGAAVGRAGRRLGDTAADVTEAVGDTVGEGTGLGLPDAGGTRTADVADGAEAAPATDVGGPGAGAVRPRAARTVRRVRRTQAAARRAAREAGGRPLPPRYRRAATEGAEGEEPP